MDNKDTLSLGSVHSFFKFIPNLVNNKPCWSFIWSNILLGLRPNQLKFNFAGIISAEATEGRYDTLFTPEKWLPRRAPFTFQWTDYQSLVWIYEINGAQVKVGTFILPTHQIRQFAFHLSTYALLRICSVGNLSIKKRRDACDISRMQRSQQMVLWFFSPFWQNGHRWSVDLMGIGQIWLQLEVAANHAMRGRKMINRDKIWDDSF